MHAGTRLLALLLAAGFIAGCEDPEPVDAGMDASRPDASTDAGPSLPEWPRGMPVEAETRRGRRLARSILHVHSPLSHDACDGEGWVDGELRDEACLAHFREALCTLHIDAAMITDHVPHLDEVELDFGLWIRDEDEAVTNGEGAVVASRMACPDGHRVLLMPGSENRLMPVLLERHPGEAGDLDSMREAYEGNTEASRAELRAAGALIWQAHTEGRTVDELRESQLDGLELYNLHANVAPNIRQDDLGLDPASYVADLFLFARANSSLPPDLAVLSFLEANRPSLDRWDTLLAEGVEVAGSGGCDAHENTFPMALNDGERADSYRRMMYWIENILLVDEVSRAGVRDALDQGRFYVTTPALGRPEGFDFIAEDGATISEMGEHAPVGSTLTVTVPQLGAEFPSDPAPTVSTHLIRSAEGGGTEVAMTTEDSLTFAADQAGAYRVEVRMTPEHARPYLSRRAEGLVREVVWVYSNPIFIDAE
ncbi:MAG: hypothetical protein AB8I08_15420 [Sandaracinaceae bacterium]